MTEHQTAFFIVSGEHETLPRAELLAILNSEGVEYGSVTQRGKLVKMTTKSEPYDRVAARALMCECCGITVGEFDLGLTRLPLMNFSEFLSAGETFAVRSVKVQTLERAVDRSSAEGRVGAEILRQVPQAKVDLRHASKKFLLAIGIDFILCGLIRGRRPQASMHTRRPRRRPVFHPSTMHPKLARCMVNLARPRAREFVLDPFCGVGGIILEASAIGCLVIGSDLSPRMLRGSKRNLAHFGFESAALVKADARAIPFQRVEAMVTDPPYGRGASTFKEDSVSVLQDFLRSAIDALGRGRFACVAAPETSKISDLAVGAGFKLKEAHRIRVHRSLTREIVVLQR